MYQVVYLTGPPAVGKTTLVSLLKARVEPMEAFVYSRVLAEFVGRRQTGRKRSHIRSSVPTWARNGGQVYEPKTSATAFLPLKSESRTVPPPSRSGSSKSTASSPTASVAVERSR